MATVAQRMRIHLLGDENIASHQTLDRLARVRGHGRMDTQQAVPWRHIMLPADPQQRETLLQQEAVAVELRRQRVARRGGAVEPAERRDAAPVDDVEEHGAIARGNVLRLDQDEIRRKFHQAGAVGRSVVDIGDDAVGGIRRVNGVVNPPGKPLVGAGAPVARAVGDIVPPVDIDPDHFRRSGRDDGQQDHRQD